MQVAVYYDLISKARCYIMWNKMTDQNELYKDYKCAEIQNLSSQILWRELSLTVCPSDHVWKWYHTKLYIHAIIVCHNANTNCSELISWELLSTTCTFCQFMSHKETVPHQSIHTQNQIAAMQTLISQIWQGKKL